MRVLAADASGLLTRVERLGGRSEYLWAHSLRVDPLSASFDDYKSVTLDWSAERGRCVLATRAIRRGEEIMRVPATAHVAFATVSSSEQAATTYTLDALGLDAATIALSLSCIESSEGRGLVHALSAARSDADERAALEVASYLRSTR